MDIRLFVRHRKQLCNVHHEKGNNRLGWQSAVEAREGRSTCAKVSRSAPRGPWGKRSLKRGEVTRAGHCSSVRCVYRSSAGHCTAFVSCHRKTRGLSN